MPTRVELPSGNYAVLRDAEELIAKDARVAKAAFSVRVAEDNSRELTGDLTDKVKYALLKETIIEWSFAGLPLPKDAVDPDGVMGGLTLKDMNKLLEAVEPSYNAVMEIEEGPKAKKTEQPSVTA